MAKSHERVLAAAVNAELASLGCTRKGRSRTWLDDQGWWVGVIEFQPSAHESGSYLNVGACFQWYPRRHFTFDLGYREGDFVRYENEEQFSDEITKLSRLARDKVVELRARLDTVAEAAKSLGDETPTTWRDYHRAVASGLAGDTAEARECFNRVIADDDDRSWAEHRRQQARNLAEHLDDPTEYAAEVSRIVRSSRAQLKLADVSGPVF